jgi:hypothetical protein
MPLGRLRKAKRDSTSEESSPTTTADRSPVNSGGPVTTVMIRNIPTRYTSPSLIDVLRDHGFDKTFDFMYLPMDFRTKKNVGYAFVNFIMPEYVEKFVAEFQGLQLKANTSQKCLEIVPSRRQGFLENIGVFGASELLTSNTQQPYFKPLVMIHDELVPLSDKLFDQLICERTMPREACPPQIKVE